MCIPVLFADQGNDFVNEVVLELHVAGDAPAGRNVAVVPALHVHRIDAEELQFAMLDATGDSTDHAAIFELVVAAAGGGKDQNGKPGMSEDEHFHVASEAAGKPLVVLAVHWMGWLLGGEIGRASC